MKLGTLYNIAKFSVSFFFRFGKRLGAKAEQAHLSYLSKERTNKLQEGWREIRKRYDAERAERLNRELLKNLK